WINVPAMASDDYVTQLATLLKDTLNPGLHIYLEYSNELWNGIFQQTSWNYNMAQSEEAANPAVLNYDNCNNSYQWSWRRVVEQLEHDESIFAGVFGKTNINRTVRPVLASQIASPYALRDQLSFLQHFYGLPDQTIYAIAGAPYIGLSDSASSDPALTIDQVI